MVQTLPIRTDLVVQAANGDVLALVEVKNREHLTPEIATAYRENLLGHGPGNWWSRFFMLVSQDVGYLWDHGTVPQATEIPPPVAFPMAPVVEFYLPSLVGRGRLWGPELELVVSQWLWDLAFDVENRPKEPEAALARTDFPRLIKGSRVGMEIDL
jgi:hypothetical protein